MIGKYWSTFVILLITWFALTGIIYQEVLVGIFLALLISTIVSLTLIPERVATLMPKGILKLLVFVPKFIAYEIVCHLKLLRIIYSPHPNIDPGIIEVPLSLKQNLQVTSVATAVTMLPGTFSLDYDNTLFIHAIDKGEKHAEFTKKLEKELGSAFS